MRRHTHGHGLALYTRIIRRLTGSTRAWDAAMETIAIMDRHAAILRAQLARVTAERYAMERDHRAMEALRTGDVIEVTSSDDYWQAHTHTSHGFERDPADAILTALDGEGASDGE